MDDLEQAILRYLGRPGARPLKPSGLVRRLGLSRKRLGDVEAAVTGLVARGELEQRRSGRLVAMQPGRSRGSRKGRQNKRSNHGLLEGPVQRTAGGAGFLAVPITAGQPPRPDLYIAPRDMRGALDGDTVRVKMLSRRRGGGQRCGRVETIISRATTQFVGRYFERGGHGWVRVNGRTWDEPVRVGDPGAKKARSGDQVVLEVVRFPAWNQQAEGVLLEVLGPRGQAGVDVQTVIREFGLPVEFPEAVLQEARAAVEAFDESDGQGRRDLSTETIVTIDPVDARDFDDAISLDELDDGGWRLGVHIADVSHFVTRDGSLDREAQRRGTSVYLPGQVIPMLPEVISNGLASLQQGHRRYAMSVLVEFSPQGVPRGTEFFRSMICVTRRLAYEQVSEILADPDHFQGRVAAPVRTLLARMQVLSRILRKRRFEAGALELQLPETKVELDREGRVESIRDVVHDESHQMIEEFMLAANVAVATALNERGVTFLRRIHPSPSFNKLRAFAEFVTLLGFDLKRFQSRQQLQKVLDRAATTSCVQAVNYALLRSLKQAEYSGREEGHYALALQEYCHFTSPIRRYPDLVIHRMIGRLIDGKRLRGLTQDQATRLGGQCSRTERRAEKAERELVRIKLLEFLKEKTGETIDALVTGVERFGVLCRGEKIPLEGLVHVSELDEEDYFEFDSASMALTGRRSGRSFQLGDRVRVEVVSVNLDERSVTLRMDPRSGRRRGRQSRRRAAGSSQRRRGKGRGKGRRKRR